MRKNHGRDRRSRWTTGSGQAAGSGQPLGKRRRNPDRHRLLPELLVMEDRTLLSTTLWVTNDNDSGTGSLPAELAAAQSGDTIKFRSSAYGWIDLTGETLTMATSDVTIDGPGNQKVAINGEGHTDFQVNAGVTASISGLEIAGGSASYGGGLWNAGTLTLTDCIITGNTATDYGGGLWNYGGTVKLYGCDVTYNTADKGGGGIGAGVSNIKVTPSTDIYKGTYILANSAAESGGGLWNWGNATVSGGSSISDNKAGRGGGIENNLLSITLSDAVLESNTANNASGYAFGGGLDNNGGTATVTQSTIESNTALDGAGVFSGMNGKQAPTATLDSCTISGNTATGGGGGVGVLYGKLTIAGGTIAGNKGGGVWNDLATATISGCTISGNSYSSGSLSNGGGVNNSGTATLTDCTVSGNSASYGGGGLLNAVSSVISLTACTIAGNSAQSRGGGLENDGKATIVDCTISGDSAGQGGGLYESSNGTATIGNTIIAGNTLETSGKDDIDGLGKATGSDNLIGSEGKPYFGSSPNVFLAGQPLGLWSLGNYGGTTQTMPLLPGSPAIGAGSASITGLTIPATDQRGLILGTSVDIGAFQSSLIVTSTSGAVDGTPQAASLTLPDAVNLSDQFAVDSISFSSTVFAAPQTITLQGSQLLLSNEALPIAIAGQPGAVTVSGGGKSTVLSIGSGVTATISGLTFTDGNGSGVGGVYNQGTATFDDCSISANVGMTDAGGIFNHSPGSLTLNDCTISGNTANQGGGVYNYYGKMLLTRCTISGNIAISGSGGGVRNNDGTVTLTGCTISDNSSSLRGGGVYVHGKATIALTDTIIAGNSEPTNQYDIDIEGGATASGSYNLIGTEREAYFSNPKTDTNNIFLGAGQSPGLGSLGEYGGPTQTLPLMAGSPAIGAGTSVAGVTTDQRGLILGTSVDIGAFQSSLIVTSTSGAVDSTPQAASLTLPDAVNLSDQFAIDSISFSSTAFAAPQTITLQGSQLLLSNSLLPIAIAGQAGAAAVTVSGGGKSAVLRLDSGVTATISGLTITGGLTNQGGGVFNDDGTLSLIDCTISDNSAGTDGGGLFSIKGSVTLTDCTISGNSTNQNGKGGGVNVFSGTATLYDCTISDNSAGSGAGLYLNNGSTATLYDCTISDNSARSDGGGMDDDGAESATLEACTISGNLASQSGGGVWSQIPSSRTLYLTDCTIYGNSATNQGGGLFTSGGTTTIAACTISGNSAGSKAGGLFIQNKATLTDTIVAGNSAAAGPDVYGTATTTSSNNLIGNGSGLSGISNNADNNQVGTASSPIKPNLGSSASMAARPRHSLSWPAARPSAPAPRPTWRERPLPSPPTSVACCWGPASTSAPSRPPWSSS